MNILTIKKPDGPHFLNLDHMIHVDVSRGALSGGLTVTFKFVQSMTFTAELTEDIAHQLENMGFSL
tara:strand:+ start:469 stop:666 length:198 start_codon:yes stop_codon:yes gene_type:complete